jgi:hypothetical protein
MLFLPAFMPGTSEAITLRTSTDCVRDDPTQEGDNPITYLTVKAEMNVEGCPLSPKFPNSSEDWAYEYWYVPPSCETLHTTTTFSINYQDPRLSNVKMKGEASAMYNDGCLVTSPGWDYTDLIDTVPAPLSQTFNVNGCSMWLGDGYDALRFTVSMPFLTSQAKLTYTDANGQIQERTLDDLGVWYCGGTIAFQAEFNSNVSTTALKGGVSDNPCTVFDSG